MFKNFLKPVVILSTIGLSSLAHAGLAQSSGGYAEGNLGLGPASKFMGDVNLGYKFNDFFAIEGGFAKFSEIKSSSDNYFFDGAIKGMMPFGNGFELFGKLGMAEAYAYDQNKPVIYIDAGLGYALTPNWSATLQGFTTTENSDVPSMYAGTIGLTYIF